MWCPCLSLVHHSLSHTNTWCTFVIRTGASAKVQECCALPSILCIWQRRVLQSEEGMRTNIVAHECLLHTGKITLALQAEWEAISRSSNVWLHFYGKGAANPPAFLHSVTYFRRGM